MRDNRNFNNVWLLIILLTFCLAFATYYTIQFSKTSSLSLTEISAPDNSKTLSDYYETPLPFGIAGEIEADRVYQIDNAFIETYLKHYVNEQAASNNLDIEEDVNGKDYLVSADVLSSLSTAYFNVDLSDTNMPYDEANDEYLVTKTAKTNVEYHVIKTSKNDDLYVIVYHEFKRAYYNGDINNQSRLFRTAKYEFGITEEDDNFIAKTYRVRYYYDLPDGYQVIN